MTDHDLCARCLSDLRRPDPPQQYRFEQHCCAVHRVVGILKEGALCLFCVSE